MTLLHLWFSYRGQLRPLDFVVKGFAPGILLGIAAMLLENAADAHGRVFYSFLVFSVWPATAMLWKVAHSRPDRQT
jgi:hypothetical protein